MARDMYGSMPGPSAWMMTDRWDFAHLALLFAMWVVMMAGMMLPSAAPTLFLYAGVIRKSPEGGRARAHVYAFAAGYLLVWTAFSLSRRRCSATVRSLAAAFTDDGGTGPRLWRHPADRGRTLSIHALQTYLSRILPVARRVYRAALETRRGRGPSSGPGARGFIASAAAGRSCCCCSWAA